jgi:hypothetical protein
MLAVRCGLLIVGPAPHLVTVFPRWFDTDDPTTTSTLVCATPQSSDSTFCRQMDTPPDIRRQYGSPPRESTEQRRKRLANRRAAKYRHFRSVADAADPAAGAQRQQQSTQRQRERRSQLDDEARDRLRAQNRRRQQLRRQSLSDHAREEIRVTQRTRQRERRQTLDDDAREELRERERLRIRRRRRQLKRLQQQHGQEETLAVPDQVPVPQPPPASDRLPHLRLAPELPTLRQHQEQQRQREQQRLPFGGGVQITLPPPMERARTFGQLERIPSLPHLQQVTRPATSLLHATPPPPLFPMPVPIAATSTTGAANVASSALPTVASAVAAAATRPSHPTPIMPSVGLQLANKPLTLAMPPQQPQQQPRTPIVLPPAHRSLPPLPDFLNSREAFNPATAAAAANATRTSRPSSSASRALFPSVTDPPATHTEAPDPDGFYQR